MNLLFPLEFVIFGITLLSVAIFHKHSFGIAISGLSAVVLYKLGFTNFDIVEMALHEAKPIINLLGLLLGFALLAKHFEESGLPERIPHYLPQDWRAGLVLLSIVFIASGFLDNIAAAIIGGTLAKVIYRDRVHIGYLAAIVTAANAGGSYSVLGDTTTTMIWISGIPAEMVLHAALGSIVAFSIFSWIATIQQHKYQPFKPLEKVAHEKIDYTRIFIVALILVGALVTNITLDFPAIGVWAAILVAAPLRKPDWSAVPEATKGATFLLSLVISASMMPVEKLPAASWSSTLSLGFISAFFDNIPLTALAIKQGGYDWGMLAYAVGYGGSMTWFGSSAGVALSNNFPESRSLLNWIRGGWHLPVACIAGFATMLLVLGWHPTEHPRYPAVESTTISSPVKKETSNTPAVALPVGVTGG